MKKILVLFVALFFAFSLISQTQHVVSNNVNKTAITCSISINIIPATNSATCDAILVFDFPGCSNFPYEATIISPSINCLLPAGVNGMSSLSYSLTGLCSCFDLVNIFIFDNTGNVVYTYSTYISTQSPTSIKKNTIENHIVVSPNPSSDFLIIKSEKKFDHVVLKSVNGIIVKEIIKDVNELTMNLDNLSDGLYFVEVYDSKELLNTKKVVVQK